MKLTAVSSALMLALVSVSADISIQNNPPYTIIKSPVDITLFVMSQCPDAFNCENTFSQVFKATDLPEINPSLSYIGSIDKSEASTAVFDPSSTSIITTTTTITKVTCKHGPLECAGNTQQLCFKEYFPDYKVWFPFVTTMNSWQPARIGEPRYAREVAEKVLELEQRRMGRLQYDQAKKMREQEVLLGKVDECSKGKQGFELLVKSVQYTLDQGIGTSCTVFIDHKKRCVVDGGVWRECPGGYSINDFVRSIKEAAGKVFRISW